MTREAILIVGDDVDDYPEVATWPRGFFALFIAVDREIDASVIASRALPQGLASMAAWGPGCAVIEDIFDELVVNDGSVVYPTDDTGTIMTTSQVGDSLEEALEYFFDGGAHEKPTRVIFALGTTGALVAQILAQL